MHSEVRQVPLAQLAESPTNPRQIFGDLKPLAASILAQGILQPLTARHVEGRLELIFGHRRFRAAKLAGLKSVPVVVRELTDVEVIEQQLVENLQREDVHPLELAAGYKLLQDKGLAWAQIMERVGVSRSDLAVKLKLLDLVPAIQKEFLAGGLTESNARVLARVDGERLQRQAWADHERLAKAHGGTVPNRVWEKHVQRRYLGERSKTVKRERANNPTGAQRVTVQRTSELLVARIAELLGRKAHLDDSDTRVLLVALAESSDGAADVLSRRGVRADRLSGLRSSRLHALLAEVVLLPWLQASPASQRGLAKVYGLDLGELESTARSLLTAEGLFTAE